MNKPTPISDAAFSMQNGYEMVPYHVAQELERRCAYLEPHPSTNWESISQGFSTLISVRDKRIQELEEHLGLIHETPITDETRLMRAYKLGQELSAICRELKGSLPEQFEEAIDHNIDSLHDILNNFARVRIHLFMEGRKCETSAS